MIQKYYNGIVEQVYNKIGNREQNISIAKYSNDFSIENLELPIRMKEQDIIYYTSYEFKSNKLSGAYEPFLDIIKDLFEQYETQSLEDFMVECEVYYLHRPIIASYMEKGIAKREEQLLMGETDYERELMTAAILKMLIHLSHLHAFMLLLNRLQFAGRSTILLINSFLKAEDTKNIGLVLGMNELQHVPEYMLPVWELMEEVLEDRNQIFRIGNAGIGTTTLKEKNALLSEVQYEKAKKILLNLAFLMDFEQALHYLEQMERKIKFENYKIKDDKKIFLWIIYAYVSIFTRDLSKALEICEEIKALKLVEKLETANYYANYLTATANMYQGKLTEAIRSARISRKIAMEQKKKEWQFSTELLEVQARMAGWSNIFFCAQNVEVSDALIEKLIHYNYLNHLAYIYIYAYDNKPEMMAKAYESESQLIYFSKGIAIAKKIGNERLIYSAYQKNIMISATNGMHEIAILYSVHTFEAMRNKRTLECARVCSGIGYNLCALGKNEDAKKYFVKAIQLAYELDLPEDIAEVYYNKALNCIALGEYKEASDDLMRCMKAIEKLRLNSLRVCNLSKLYGLLALCNQKIGNRFNCEQYLNNCKQFLNYIIEKENVDSEIGIIHDYAKCDDDMFLYYFSLALLDEEGEDGTAAFEHYSMAEKHLLCAEGNQFYCYRLFRKSRIEFYEKTGCKELLENERALLEQYEQSVQRPDLEENLKVLQSVEDYLFEEEEAVQVPHHEIDIQLHQESINRAYIMKKRQLDFISSWQKLISVTDVLPEQIMDTVMKTFLYHFTLDKALYIQYVDEGTQILYNNTEREITPKIQQFLADIFEESQKGFAVSKISNNYAEHVNVVSLFGEDNVCSMVAIPFIYNGKVESILITYVLMKDNWHSSVNRYMLDEDDMNMYELLFREVQNSLNRLNAYEKIYKMNTMLYQSAVMDQLTGIYNRKGFYQNIEDILKKIHNGVMEHRFGLMFIDLDNFKGYNDTFGHNIGDLILKSMAGIFHKVCGDLGFVCRYGGDEFIMFLNTDEREVLETMVKQIYMEIDAQNGFQEAISNELQQPVEIDATHKISCSIGIVTSDRVETEEDINRMVKQADDLLYTIKTTTKGTYTFL